MVKWIFHVINQWNVKLFKRYEWERFDNDFNVKDANMLAMENAIPPSHKENTKAVYL